MKSVVIWFPSDSCPDTHEHVVFWQQYLTDSRTSADCHSLPAMVHDEADRWKHAYLEWVARIGQAPIRGVNLEQRLKIRPRLSYWWMTVPTEFSFTEDALAYVAIRLWAFAEFADDNGLTDVKLVGASQDVARAMHVWGRLTGRKVTAERAPKLQEPPLSLRHRIRNSSNVGIQALFAVRHIGKVFLEYGPKQRQFGKRSAPRIDELTIVDDLAHLIVDGSEPPKFSSHYWGSLPAQLASWGKRVHWIHLDYRSTKVTSLRESRRIVESMDGNFANQRHTLLQDDMTVGMMARSVVSLCRIQGLGIRLARSHLSWRHSASGMDLWPVVKRTWRRSFYGATAAQNALWLELFRFEEPTGSCLYLMENQPWELVLVNNWRTSVEGGVFGVIHSSVRGWDLRYSAGYSSGRGKRHALLPRPTATLANGPFSHLQLSGHGFDASELLAVEALRYIANEPDVHRVPVDGSSAWSCRLLALGEYDHHAFHTQVRLLNALVNARPNDVSITFRPHPGALHDLSSLDSRIVLSSSQSIRADLATSDAAFCSSVSTASLDALLAGVPTILYRDGGVLDAQLLPSGPSSVSVTSATQLIAAIDALPRDGGPSPIAADMVFNLDAELPHWRRFFADFT